MQAADNIVHRTRTGPRSPSMDAEEVLLDGFVMPFPQVLLDQAHTYRFAEQKMTQADAFRDLIALALKAWNKGRKDGVEISTMPSPPLTSEETRVLVRLSAGLYARLEDFQFETRRRTRKQAVHDLLWAGFQIWDKNRAAASTTTSE